MVERKSKKMVQARVGLLMHHPFFGYLAIKLQLVEREDLNPPTMATDGVHLYYHPDFAEEVSKEELEGVIAHEIAHIVLWHLPRRQNRDKNKWNIAADFAVNDLILQEFRLPKDHLYNRDWHDKSADWIYNQLPDAQSGGGGQGTLDSHEEWENWGKSGLGNGEGEDSEGGGLEQQWREAVAQASTAARMKGKFPGHLKTLVGEILQPKLDWKTILRDMVTSCAKNDYRLIPPNMKHLYRGIYLPGTTGEEINIAVVIDTSGSISDEEIKKFLAEIKGICDAYTDFTIHLLSCDARIHQRWELHPFDPLPTEFTGRGGTSFVEPIVECAKLDITSLFYLTDGYGTFPDRPFYSVIWVLSENHYEEIPWGMEIVMRGG